MSIQHRKAVQMEYKRNRNGEGTWRETASGNIEYRFTYTDEYGNRKVKSVTGVSENHCLERAEEFLDRLRQKLEGINLDATIPELLYEKIENDFRKNYTGEQGYERNLRTIETIEKSAIGHMPIADIRVYHIERYLQSLTRYSNNTISKFYSMIKLAFAVAVDRGIVRSNLMENRSVKCPISDRPDKKVRGLTEEEQMKFIKALGEYKPQNNHNTYRLQLLIELYSGMRMGEINALRPECINFSKGFIHVDRTISHGKASPFLKEGTKTKAGERDVPISAVLKPLLEEALEQMGDNPDNLIFYDYNKGGVITTNQVCSMYKKICKDAGIPYYGQHALRHTFATRCIEAGIQPVVLKGWLGHTNIHVTLDTYADVFDRMNLGAISKFEDYMDKVLQEEE